MKHSLALPSFALLLCLGCETAGLGSMTSTQCMKEADSKGQDACYFDLVAQAAENNDLETCLREMVMIKDPLLRASATRLVISEKPQGMEIITATNLCQQLTEAEAADCDRSWNRPHLWKSR